MNKPFIKYLTKFYYHLKNDGFSIYNLKDTNNLTIYSILKDDIDNNLTLNDNQEVDFFVYIHGNSSEKDLDYLNPEFIKAYESFVIKELNKNKQSLNNAWLLIQQYHNNPIFIFEHFSNNKEMLNYYLSELYKNSRTVINIEDFLNTIIPMLEKLNIYNNDDIDSIILNYYSESAQNYMTVISNRDFLLAYYKEQPDRLEKLINQSDSLKILLKKIPLVPFLNIEDFFQTKINISFTDIQKYFFIDYFSIRKYSLTLQKLAETIANEYHIKSEYALININDLNGKQNNIFPEDDVTHINLIFTHNDKNKFNNTFFSNIIYDFFTYLQKDTTVNNLPKGSVEYISELLPSWLMQHSLNQSILGHDNHIKKNKI